MASACAANCAFAQSHQTPAEVATDIQKNGPYSQRYNPRVLSAPATAPVQLARPLVPGSLVFDAATKDTNELVVLLNYASAARLGQLIPENLANATAPAVERAFERAIKSRSPLAIDAAGNPIHVRPLLFEDRMRDAERVAQEFLTSGASRKPNPRERLERYFVVRYDSVALARAAMERMKKDSAFAHVGMNKALTWSAAPTDAYYSAVSGQPAWYQWGMHNMSMQSAWDVTTGGAYIGLLDQAWPGQINNGALQVHDDLKRNFRQHMVNRAIDVQGGGYNHTVHVAGIVAAEHSNTTIGANPGYVAGGCPECSVVTYPLYLANATGTSAEMAGIIRGAVEGGMQILNWSGGLGRVP